MERVGREVERRLSQTGGGQGLALAEITTVWTAAVGEAIARNAWPLRLGTDGTLHVAASSATWAFELDRMSAEIADRLAVHLAESAPTKLRFRPGPVPEPASEAEPRPPAETRETPPEIAAAAASAAAAIEDSALRELVARAARASLRETLGETPGETPRETPPGGRSDRGFW
jgi:hypothetical protein